MDAAPYVMFVLCLLCAAAAIWQLYTSTEERAERGSFLYKYAAFFAYILLLIVFIVLLFRMSTKSLEESIIKMSVVPTLGPVGAFVLGKAAITNSTPKFRKNSLLG